MELENYKSDEPCIACGEAREGYVCYHHVTTQGAWGSDEKWNLLPVCFIHHEQIHKGLEKFIKRFPQVQDWLLVNKWEYVDFLGKWIRPIEEPNKSVDLETVAEIS